MQNTYVPQRRCIACRQSFPQGDLIRIVLTENGLHIKNDINMDGRSCYICRNQECIRKAFDKNGFSKSFRRSFEKEELAALKESIIKIV